MILRSSFVLAALACCLVAPHCFSAVSVGDDAPELKAKEWLNTSAPLTLADLKNQVVVVEFWATNCGICVRAIPKLNQLQQKYKNQGVTVVGLTKESKDVIEQYAKDKKIQYPLGLEASFVRTWGVKGIPAAFIIGPNQKIVWSGSPLDDLDKIVAKTLREMPPKK